VPFPTTRPVNLVFHGNTPFSYGHYGIHLGQEDRLTFLGDSGRLIHAHFIDCRSSSESFGKRLTVQFCPTSEFTLCIPPGVAHAFDGLEDINTLNSYTLYLPDPVVWANGGGDWNSDSDVVNIPMDVADEALPRLNPNTHKASDRYYELVADQQATNIPLLKHEYPSVEEVALADGTSVRLALRKRLNHELKSDSDPLGEIDGVRWERHLVVPSGPSSGFVPVLDSKPFYIVDHGEHEYTHDAFGIHLGQEDRLTFLGPDDSLAEVTLVDCREHSPTLHNTATIQFKADATRFLVIPNGVAHRFSNLQRIFTLNRPHLFADDENTYQPGNDVVDWPVGNDNFPRYIVSSKPVSQAFYNEQVSSQRELLSAPPKHSTPIVLTMRDEQNNEVRVALRKKLAN
jgi:dTDP-4-dehydrorhamnose 3,5-epimerase-like enzyme